MAAEMAPAKALEIRHEFTEVQHQHLAPIVNQVGQLQAQIQWFMSYIAAEEKLPKPMGGWQLKMDPASGRPYMSGMVPETGENK